MVKGPGIQLPTVKALAELCKQQASKSQYLLKVEDMMVESHLRNGDSGGVLSSAGKMTSRSGGL